MNIGNPASRDETPVDFDVSELNGLLNPCPDECPKPLVIAFLPMLKRGRLNCLKKLLELGNFKPLVMPPNDDSPEPCPGICILNGIENAVAAEAKSAIDTHNINNTTNTLILTLLIGFYMYAMDIIINILFYPFGTPMKLKYRIQVMPNFASNMGLKDT